MPTSWAAKTLWGSARDPDHLAATSGDDTAKLMPAVTIANPGQ